MQTSEEPQHCLKILTTTFMMGIVETLFWQFPPILRHHIQCRILNPEILLNAKTQMLFVQDSEEADLTGKKI